MNRNIGPRRWAVGVLLCAVAALQGCEPVSYTHLTLPTILLV